MKNEEMLKLIGEIDDRLVDEASPMNKENVKKNDHQRKIKRISLMAACIACLVTAVSLWLFVPFNTDPPSVDQYKNSEYYDLICKINEMTYTPPYYKNNYEKLLYAISSSKSTQKGPSNETDSFETDSYKEVTDNQIEGVVEADIFKRSDKYIYYLKNDAYNGCKDLEIYSVDYTDPEPIARLEVDYDVKGMYLSSDCQTLTIISNSSDFTKVTTYDVTNSYAKEINSKYISGKYCDSRMINDELIVLTYFKVSNSCDFSNPKTYLPYVYDGSDYDILQAREILQAKYPETPCYTVVCRLGSVDLDVLDKFAYFSYVSYNNNFYITHDNVYMAFEYVYVDVKNNEVKVNQTEISCLNFTDKFTHKGTVTVNGWINDQYSMDEYDGVFRVVTSTRRSEFSNGEYNNSKNADLYCIDINTFEIISSVISFAPEGEYVNSVRFDKTAAYVCTSIYNTDPVFFFDLTDVNNITYTDTGTIPGFSTSLINMGNGYLLGVGVGESEKDVKIEVYKQGEGKVESVDSFEIKNAKYSSSYKSYYIDREKGLFGLAVEYLYDLDEETWEWWITHFYDIDWQYGSYMTDLENIITDGKYRYILFKFDKEQLTPLTFAYIGYPYEDYYIGLSNTRATIIDEKIYIFSDGQCFIQMLPKKYLK